MRIWIRLIHCEPTRLQYETLRLHRQSEPLWLNCEHPQLPAGIYLICRVQYMTPLAAAAIQLRSMYDCRVPEQKHGTMCREALGKLAQLRLLARPTKTTGGRWRPSHDTRDAIEEGDEDDEAYDQRKSLRGLSGAMRTQPTSTCRKPN
jgi:hypothetical protein